MLSLLEPTLIPLLLYGSANFLHLSKLQQIDLFSPSKTFLDTIKPFGLSDTPYCRALFLFVSQTPHTIKCINNIKINLLSLPAVLEPKILFLFIIKGKSQKQSSIFLFNYRLYFIVLQIITSWKTLKDGLRNHLKPRQVHRTTT